MITFICTDCTHKQHTKCKGGTWCECQHRPDRFASNGKK